MSKNMKYKIRDTKNYILKILLTCYLAALFFHFSSASAASALDIVISEIAWMGTIASDDDEWIELYNNTNSEIDLNGWSLQAQDGTPKISLSGKMSAKSFYILERTDDTTIADLAADQFYTGALNNAGEHLILKDKEGNIIDEVNGWYAGDASRRATMERINLSSPGNIKENWQTAASASSYKDAKGNNIIGSPKALTIKIDNNNLINNNDKDSGADDNRGSAPDNQNQTSEISSNQTLELTIQFLNQNGVFEPVDEIFLFTDYKIQLRALANISLDRKQIKWNDGRGKISDGFELKTKFLFPGSYIITAFAQKDSLAAQKQLKANVFPKGIIISEFLPNPKGRDVQNEWVELYNRNDFAIDLGGFILEINDNKFTFAPATFIYPESFLVIPLGETNLILRNSKGNIFLKAPNDEEIDAVIYEKPPKENYSAARENENSNVFYWTSKPTPGFANLINPTKSFSDFLKIDKASVSQKEKNVIMINNSENIKNAITFEPRALSDLSLAVQPKDNAAAKATTNDSLVKVVQSPADQLLGLSGEILANNKSSFNEIFTPFNILLIEIFIFAVFASFFIYRFFYRR